VRVPLRPNILADYLCHLDQVVRHDVQSGFDQVARVPDHVLRLQIEPPELFNHVGERCESFLALWLRQFKLGPSNDIRIVSDAVAPVLPIVGRVGDLRRDLFLIASRPNLDNSNFGKLRWLTGG
jgi:hypothetical protein